MTPKPDCTLDNASRSPVDVLLLLFHIHPRSHVLRQLPYCKSPSCCPFLVGPSWYCSPRTVPEHSNSFVVRPSGSIHQQHEVLWQLHPRSGPKSTLSGHYDHGFSYLFVCLWNSSESLGHLSMFLRLFLKPSLSLDTATPSPNPSSSSATMYPFDDTCKQDSSTLIMKFSIKLD